MSARRKNESTLKADIAKRLDVLEKLLAIESRCQMCGQVRPETAEHYQLTQLIAELIVWLKTPAGKNMPVDADTVEPSDELYDPSRHVSHFKTCTAPNRFSKGNKR